MPTSGVPYSLTLGDYSAEIAGVGATLRRLTHRGRDLIVPFDADQVRPYFRGATLVPWPNRVVDGRYTFGGAEHQLALTEPARHHALHGLGAWLEWRPDGAAVESSRVSLIATIEPQSGYPWRVEVRTTYALDEGGLTQQVSATNISETSAPFGAGPHPYLCAPGTLDDWTLELPAARVLQTTSDRLIPTTLTSVSVDAARFDFRAPRRIGDAQIDHAFTELERDTAGIATVTVRGDRGTGAGISWDGACPWVQVHTADLPGGAATEGHRAGLAVEPMTCAPDAFNADAYPYPTGLVTLEPGTTAAASWRIFALS